MKKIMVMGLMVVMIVTLSMATVYAGPFGPGDTQWNYCPFCGSYVGPGGGFDAGQGMMGPGYSMGPGLMGRGYGMRPGMMGPGYDMGPGMMGPAYGMGPGMMGPSYGMGPGIMHRGWGWGPQYGPRYQQAQAPMSEKDAKAALENYLQSTRNPNLKLGKIEDRGNAFEGEIVTAKEGSLVDKILVDKYTSWMRSVY
jgi:hypothetical protein